MGRRRRRPVARAQAGMKGWLAALLFAAAAGFGGGAAAQDKRAFSDDEVITARVKQAILSDAVLRGMDISIVTEEKVVRLMGFVDSLGDIGRASVLAEGVAGVLRVRNGLRIAIRPTRA
jgi:osmotically-inducible protein OsmY